MKQVSHFLIRLSLLLITCSTCSKASDDDALICDGSLQIVLIAQNGAPCGIPMGSFTVTANGGVPPYSFRIDNGSNWQADGQFVDLYPAAYRVTVIDTLGCTAQTGFNLVNGISFQESVEPIISSVCATAGCHVAGEEAPNLAIRTNIFTAASRMRSLISLADMPPAACNCPLTAEEKQNIICWIDDGGQDN